MMRRGILVTAASMALLATTARAQVVVSAQSDLYKAAGFADGSDGTTPPMINVTGLTSITFNVVESNSAFPVQNMVTVNSGGNFNTADGVGAASGEFNTGAGPISAITVPTAGFLAGVFLGATTPTAVALNYTAGGNASLSAASYTPTLDQAFFIGDGLTGAGTGTVQTFYVPTGATALYLGLTDACGYSGGPSCYSDNSGQYAVTVNGAGIVSGAPEPSTWALLLAGVAMIGGAMRISRRRGGASFA